MEKTKKFKIFIGLFYLFFITLFLYYLFSKFTLQEITSYDFREVSLYFNDVCASSLFYYVRSIRISE